jgi:hypothetical protein
MELPGYDQWKNASGEPCETLTLWCVECAADREHWEVEPGFRTQCTECNTTRDLMLGEPAIPDD